MIEEDLRATFARHEPETPAAGPVRDRIKIAAVRRKRRRTTLRAVGAAAALLLAAGSVPVVLAHRDTAPTMPYSLLIGTVAPVPAGALDVLLLSTGSGVKGAHLDTVTLVHVPADRRTVYLINLPLGAASLVSAFDRGGANLARRMASELLGVAVDAAVVVDRTALADATELAQGVHVCLGETPHCKTLHGRDVPALLGSGADHDRQRFLAALTRKLAKAPARTDPVALDKAIRPMAGLHLSVDGPAIDLLRAAAGMRSPAVVSITDPIPTSMLYPAEGPGLFAAVHADNLAAWTVAHPSYVLKP